MAVSTALTHVAMSVPEGTLTDEYRAQVLEFYGRLLGWREMASLRRPDRLTITVGPTSYINLREQPRSIEADCYEHFGVLVASPDELRRVWDDLDGETADVQLEALEPNDKGEGTFRFRHLLPMAVEVQFYAVLAEPLPVDPPAIS